MREGMRVRATAESSAVRAVTAGPFCVFGAALARLSCCRGGFAAQAVFSQHGCAGPRGLKSSFDYETDFRHLAGLCQCNVSHPVPAGGVSPIVGC